MFGGGRTNRPPTYLHLLNSNSMEFRVKFVQDELADGRFSWMRCGIMGIMG